MAWFGRVMQPVHNSSLPRFKRLMQDSIQCNYNAYGIARLDQPVAQILLVEIRCSAAV
jgi:hypothetical protein